MAAHAELPPHRPSPRDAGRHQRLSAGLVAVAAVMLEVVSRRPQHRGIVLELPQPAVAVEAEQLAYGAGFVVVIDVRGGRCSADRTEPVLQSEKVIGLLSRDPVSPRKVIRAISAALFSVGSAAPKTGRSNGFKRTPA